MQKNRPAVNQNLERQIMNQQADVASKESALGANDWLEDELVRQANVLGELPISSDSVRFSSSNHPTSVPTVYQLRERTLKRREQRARILSFASSAAVLLTIVGWGVFSFQQQTETTGLVPVVGEGNLASVTPVSANSAIEIEDAFSDSMSNQYQMVARWWEPVTVEWVDANGRSLGVAGVVAEERMSTLDPAKLSNEQLELIKAYLSESHHNQARNHFSGSHEPAF